MSTVEQLDLAAHEAIKVDHLPDASQAFAQMLQRDPLDAFAHAWLGQIAIRDGNLVDAEREFRQAASKVEARMSASDPAELYARRVKQVQTEESVQRIRERLDGGEGSCTAETALRISPVTRLHRSALSNPRFMTDFAHARRPVVITGFDDGLAERYWSFDRLRDVCGDMRAPLRRHEAASSTWAGLRESSHDTF